MPGAATKYLLAPTGSTGNNTHTAVSVADHNDSAIAFQFVVEVIGATPTVTWKFQGSQDADSTALGAPTWYDLPYVTDANDTVAVAAIASTIVGGKVVFFDHNSYVRSYKWFRAVSSLNTNCTYRAEMYVFEG